MLPLLLAANKTGAILAGVGCIRKRGGVVQSTAAHIIAAVASALTTPGLDEVTVMWLLLVQKMYRGEAFTLSAAVAAELAAFYLDFDSTCAPGKGLVAGVDNLIGSS